MTRLVLKRLALAVLVVWVAMSGVFVFANLIGDPAVATLGARANPDQIRDFRRRHGLDRPFHEQYLSYFGGLLSGDLGRSFSNERPVTEILASRLPRTALLGTMALGFELVLGLVLGTLAALRRGTLFDTAFMAAAFLGISAPSFLTGLIFLYVFGFRLGLFPIGGYGLSFADHLYHAVLPAFTLAILGAATYARIMRSEMIETMRSDFVRTARAKGLSEPRVVLGHALRNASLPVVTLVGLSLPLLVSGAIITESIYNWPGMGRLAIESVHALDVPTLLGVVFVASLAVQAGNLLADLAVAWLDPRVRAE